MLTSLLEHFILVSIDMNATRDHYISTTFLAMVVFIFTLKCNNYQNNENITHKMIGGGKNVTGVLSVIGCKYSTWIYILHPIFIIFMKKLTNKIGIYEIYKFIAPVFVYTITILFLVIWHKIKIYGKPIFP